MSPSELLRAGGGGIVIFYALIAGALFLLQAFPFTGVILMILGGPVWIGALVHLLMAHLTIAAALRKVEIAWLLAPFAYYGGGFAAHLESVREAKSLADMIAMENASQSLPIDGPLRYLASNFEALELLDRYRVDSAVTKELMFQGKREYGLHYYAKNSDCLIARRFPDPHQRSEPWAFRPDLFQQIPAGAKTAQCILLKDVYDASWRLEIASRLDRNVESDSLIRPRLIAWEARDPHADISVTVRVGAISTLPPIITFAAGCTLDSGTPAWRCGATPLFDGERIAVGVKPRTDGGNPFIPSRDPETWEVSALGRALGLSPRQPSD